MTEQEQQLIADQADLEAFARLPPGQRQVTDRLKGVLAETAVTGVIRYPWPLLQPVLAHMMQEQLAKYEADEHVEVGPARPILGASDDSVAALVERFSKLLAEFDNHPWTLQRLCEVLLEPQKQYKRLHKLALAIEKLLLVTGELDVSEQPGPPPALSQLTRINEAPPPPAGSAAAGSGAAASRQADADGGGLVAAALDIRQQQPQQQQQQQQPQQEAAPAAAAGNDPMQVDAAPAAGPGPADETAAAAAAADAGDTDMQAEPPAAVAAAAATAAGAAAQAEGAAGAVRAAAADTDMATEEAPVVTDHQPNDSQTNAVDGSS